MSALYSTAIPLPQISLGFASIGAAYALVGKFSKPLEWIEFTSTLNQPVIISFDGVTDFTTIPAGSTVPVFFPINFKTNHMVLPATSVWVKQASAGPGSGTIYVSGISATTP